MTSLAAKWDVEDFSGLPNPADVEAAFKMSNGAAAAHAWLAEHGVSHAVDAKMIAVDDKASDDTFVVTDAEPDWIAVPVYQGGEFVDLCLIHRNNPNAFHTVCSRAVWLGADNTDQAKVVIHENPVDWLKADCKGVVSIAAGGFRQHFKELARACTIEVSTIDAANDVWEWTFGGAEQALKKIQLNGDADDIKESLAWQAADTAKRRVRDTLDVPAGADLHKLFRQVDAVFLPAPANDNEGRDRINVIDPSDWEGQPIPERQWYLEGLIPNRQVTLLSGDGGTGKSLLAYQVGLAGVLGIETLGLSPAEGRVTYLAAEDDEAELKRRGFDILRSMDRTWADLKGNMRVIPLAGKDAELVSEKRRSRDLELTALAVQITDLLAQFEPKLLILDTAADVFGGDEINRKQVRFFVSMLRRLAMDFDMAVLLLSHPSVQGMQSGTGLSGSTAWNNSVRSRLYFTADKGDEDLRLLKNMKANYGRKGAELKLRWHEGAFILDDGKPSAHAALLANHADEAFLKMLSAINGSGRRVSSSRSSAYAPTVMAAMPERGASNKKSLEEAMARLFAQNKIAVIKEGPPSRQRERLVVVDDVVRQKRMAEE